MTNSNPASGNDIGLFIDRRMAGDMDQMNRLLWRVLDLAKAGTVVADRLHSRSLDAGVSEEGDPEWQGLFGLFETIELLTDQANQIAVRGMSECSKAGS